MKWRIFIFSFSAFLFCSKIKQQQKNVDFILVGFMYLFFGIGMWMYCQVSFYLFLTFLLCFYFPLSYYVSLLNNFIHQQIGFDSKLNEKILSFFMHACSCWYVGVVVKEKGMHEDVAPWRNVRNICYVFVWKLECMKI